MTCLPNYLQGGELKVFFFFENVKLPQLVRREKSERESIPLFDCNDLAVKQRIGQGAFGAQCCTSDYINRSRSSVETQVQVKLFVNNNASGFTCLCRKLAYLNRGQAKNGIVLEGP